MNRKLFYTNMHHRQKILLRFPWELTHCVVQILIDCNVLFQVTIEETKAFLRRGKKWWERGPHNGKLCLLGEACSTTSPTSPTNPPLSLPHQLQLQYCFLPSLLCIINIYIYVIYIYIYIYLCIDINT